MTNINLERRAEIGREKRARTKARLIAAAKALYSTRPWESVTVDEVVNEAGGTPRAPFTPISMT